MSFPEHIARVLDDYGVPADTKAALYELYIALGGEVLDVFSDLSDRVASPTLLRPEDTKGIRAIVVERYLTRNQPQWVKGQPTPSLWHPRETEGRASGLATPVGSVSEATKKVIGDAQPVPEGVVMLGRNAHSGGRLETFSFDIVPSDLADALAIGRAEGQQHTLPGSVGETSATYDATAAVALIWEIQPNVFKPAGDRNRAISKVYRKHRNWHLATLVAAIEWLRGRNCAIYILRGEALAATHGVNPAVPVTQTIVDLHNRTVRQVAEGLDIELQETTEEDGFKLLDSTVMNHSLRQHVLKNGTAGLLWRL
jgi:hypothetical protein